MDEGNVGKDLALKEKQEFEEKVLEAIENLKADGESLTLNGIQYTYVKGSYTMKFEDTDIEFGLIGQDGKFTYNKENFIEAKKALEEQGINLEELGLPDIEQWIDEQEKMKENNKEENSQEQEKEEEQKDEKDLSEDMDKKDKKESEEKDGKKPSKEETEQEKINIKGKTVQKMDMNRRITDDQSFREWIKVNLHVKPDNVYRIQTGSHDFEYIGEYNEEYKPLPLSTNHEGKNTRQPVHIVKENLDGKPEVVVEEVDSLLLSSNGEYGIVTKVPDGVSDVTKSFSVRRTPDGKYLATQLIEDSGPNKTDREIPGGEIADTQKKSKYDVEKFLDEEEEMKKNNMEVTQDGITVDEIILYGYFKNKGYTPDAIDRMIKDINENEIYPDEAEKNEKERAKTKTNEKYSDFESRKNSMG